MPEYVVAPHACAQRAIIFVHFPAPIPDSVSHTPVVWQKNFIIKYCNVMKSSAFGGGGAKFRELWPFPLEPPLTMYDRMRHCISCLAFAIVSNGTDRNDYSLLPI